MYNQIINDQYLRDLIHGYRNDKNIILDEIKILNIGDQIFIMKELISMLTTGHIRCDGAKLKDSEDSEDDNLRYFCSNSGIVMCMYCKLFICFGDDRYNDIGPCVKWKLCQNCGVVACKECKNIYDTYLKDPNDEICHYCPDCYNNLKI